VAEAPAVNSSPLIVLARAGQIGLLQLAAVRIVVPGPVYAELRARGAADPAVAAIDTHSWLAVTQTPAVPALIQAWDLGPGESAVLAWGYAHQGTEVIIDDLAARRCAAALGIPVHGTLGLVLVARKRGVIPAARPVLEQLRRGGMFLSERVRDRALALVGE
jgi:predicted nucleic acid-binding protein